jgi:hypothetical protein
MPLLVPRDKSHPHSSLIIITKPILTFLWLLEVEASLAAGAAWQKLIHMEASRQSQNTT